MTAEFSEAAAEADLRRHELEQASREHRDAAAALDAAKRACEVGPGKKTLDAVRAARVALEAATDALGIYAALQPIVADLADLAHAIHAAAERVDAVIAAQQSAWIEAESLAGSLGVPVRAAQLPHDLASTHVRVALFNAGVPDVSDWVRPEWKPRLLSVPMTLHERAKQLLAIVEAVA